MPKNTTRRRHQRALPHSEVAAAIATVQASAAHHITKLALEVLIATPCRSGEVRGGRWDEIIRRIRRIPDSRMKAGLEHRVTLSSRAFEVLNEARRHTDGSNWVFPSPTGRPLIDGTMSRLLRENSIGAVPHGFRSS